MKEIIKIMVLAIVSSLLMVGCRPLQDGTELLQECKYEEAIESFDTTIEKWGENDKKKLQVAEAYRGKGIAYWEMGNYEKAKEAFQTALAKGTEKTGTIYNFIGICEMKAGNFTEALNQFNQGLACEGNQPELIQEMEFNQVSAYEELRDWPNAKAKIAEYITKYPDDADGAKEAQFLETR
ncbi:MAG: tetratricopeptide repeat protein [Lachnospiraceae bacterium]